VTPPRRPYATDLTDAEWQLLAPFIPAPKPGGRPTLHDRPGKGAAAVPFQPELALEGLEGALDPLPQAPQRPQPAGLISPVGSQQPGAMAGDELVEVTTGNALVAQDDQARAQLGALVVQQGLDDLALTQLGAGQAPGDRQPVTGGQDMEPEPPEVAVVALAVALPAWPASADRLTVWRLAAHGTGVESTSRSWSPQLGVWAARSWMARATSGPARRKRRLSAEAVGRYGNRWPSRWPAKRSQRRSEPNPSSTWATARQTSSASASLGGRPGPRRGSSSSSMVT
jgi:hypothetical protein